MMPSLFLPPVYRAQTYFLVALGSQFHLLFCHDRNTEADIQSYNCADLT